MSVNYAKIDERTAKLSSPFGEAQVVRRRSCGWDATVFSRAAEGNAQGHGSLVEGRPGRLGS